MISDKKKIHQKNITKKKKKKSQPKPSMNPNFKPSDTHNPIMRKKGITLCGLSKIM